MLVRRNLNSKIGLGLVTIGVGFVMIGMVLAFNVFGITFGTFSLITSGLFLILYGMSFGTFVNKNLNYKLLLLNRILSLLLVIGLVSFIWIETLVFQSLKSNDNVRVNYVVVLGAGIQGEEPSLTLKRRLDKSIEYLSANPNSTIIASGGFGKEVTISEAEVMKRYLIAHGISESRILKEEKSMTSDENLRYTKLLLTQLYGAEVPTILIITSDYHMFRAKHIAYRYYPVVYGISSETPRAIMINYAIREYLAVLKMLAFEVSRVIYW